MARTIAKDYDQKRLKILATAARVFAEEGIARASMSQVANECGISKANIYHYYDSKDALLFDILDSYLFELKSRICALPSDKLSPEERLFQLASEILFAYEGMDNEHKIQIEGTALLPSEQQEILRGYQRDMVDRMGDILSALAPEAFKKDPGKLRETTMSVFGMLNWFYMWNRKADRKTRQQYAELVSQLTVGGVKSL